MFTKSIINYRDNTITISTITEVADASLGYADGSLTMNPSPIATGVPDDVIKEKIKKQRTTHTILQYRSGKPKGTEQAFILSKVSI